MTLLKTKKEATTLLENGDIRECLNYLKDNLNDNSSARSNLTLLYSRFNRLMDDKILGENVRTDENIIARDVRDVIQRIEEKDLGNYTFIETLLIICNAGKRLEMENFFGKKYFPNAAFINYGQAIPAGVFDVVFLEDEDGIINKTQMQGKIDKVPTTENINRRAEMKAYIEANVTQYFIYIGKYFPLGYENRVYFSNSRFSIYARLKEILDYIKYYGK